MHAGTAKKPRSRTTARRALLVPATILALALSSDGASSEAVLSFFPAIRVAELEAGATVRGDEYLAAEFTTLDGARVPIRRAAEPIVTLRSSDVVSAIVQEAPTISRGDVQVVASVRLRIDEELENKFRGLHERHPDDWVLVELAGKPVDLAPIAGRSEPGLPGGVFRSVEEAVASYRPFQTELRVEKASAELIGQWDQYAVEFRRAARWYEECEPKTYEEFRMDGFDLEIDPSRTPSAPDCSERRPQFPPPHPAFTEACVEAGSQGETREGRRVGLWSVRNPYGETIRLDHFRDGVLERSVWMRSCPQE